MSGIPVYTNAGIKPSKASAVTPQTAAPQSNIAASAPATTTATSSSSYPPAKPGSAAFPGPTAAAQRYVPVNPTPTTNTEPEGPPAPQPGPVPTLLSRTAIPPPPRAVDSYQPPQRTEAAAQTYPSQMTIPPPTTAYGSQVPASSTTTSTSASVSYPVGIPADYEAPRRSLDHPPGEYTSITALCKNFPISLERSAPRFLFSKCGAKSLIH